MKVIAISGKAGSGKTTLANNLVAHLSSKGTDVAIMKFAEPIYSVQEDIQVTLNKSQKKDRNLMLGIADLLKDNYGEDIFTETLMRELKSHEDWDGVVIIDDLRFSRELDSLFASGLDILAVRLDAPESLLDSRVGVPANRSHISEIDLDNAMFDLYINVEEKDQEGVLNEVTDNL